MAKTYDSKQVLVIVNGVPITGFDEKKKVIAERNDDAFTLKVGSDGDAARSKSNNKSGTITISLLQTSMSNDFLSGIAIADELTGAGTALIMIKDLLGNSLACCTGWVKRMPKMELGSEVSGRDWVIETDKLNLFEGGNLL